jgi:signal peptidase I
MDCQISDSFTEQMFDIWKEVGNESALQVSGWSMRPLIKDGDTVVVKHTHQGIKPGATIAFKKDQRIVVHRVLRCYTLRGETVYVNRGDHNQHIDSRVRESAILGKVVAIVRKDGKRTNLESLFWRGVGYMVVRCVDFSRILPRQIRELKVVRAFGRVVIKVLGLA